MTRHLQPILFCALFAATSAAAGPLSGMQPGRTEASPATISTALGAFNVDHTEFRATAFRVEVEPGLRLGALRAVAAAGLTSHGTSFVGAGFSREIFLGGRLVLTPSLLANHYSRGSSGHDLGHRLEFRSQAMIALRFSDRSRIGLALAHYSNAGLGERNPGSEEVALYYTVPIRR